MYEHELPIADDPVFEECRLNIASKTAEPTESTNRWAGIRCC